MPTFSIRDQRCVNPTCSAGRVVVHSRKHARLRCTACGKTWVAHVRTVQYRLRSPSERVEQALLMLQAGAPIRKVAELCEASPSTVHRWKMRDLRHKRNTNLNSYECL